MHLVQHFLANKPRNSQTNMEACFVTSKPFSEKLFPLLGSRISCSTRRRSSVSQFHQLKKVGTPLSVTCEYVFLLVLLLYLNGYPVIPFKVQGLNYLRFSVNSTQKFSNVCLKIYIFRNYIKKTTYIELII